MGMAWRPGEELAPRGRTGYSDAELMKAEEELLPALSEPRRHGRPPGVSALPRDPHHPTTLRPLPPPPPPPPPPPRRPPPTPHTLPSCSGEPLLSIRHFRAQAPSRGTPFAILGAGKLSFFRIREVWAGDVLPPRPTL
ncbi:uncharacterized protein LOC127695897 isoform X2 [Apodemus sylvaticus]|uniref:uncharacterized protein LOC127695897 isoform X2 n=1 Tax=Apodemus sylvaticus TaxID=10129 RepID=UPI002241EAF8|nr:uncharacterized protein LOC127695897 isoform X2 [Apodemus sylvaticus]